MPITELGKVRLYYETYGTKGDSTVLVHGSLVDHHTWDAVRTMFGQSLKVLVYDRRGHGQSVGPPRARPVRDDAADLAALLESLDLFPVHLIAHSYAGAVALRFAIDRPEMVRSLSLHEPPFVGLLALDPASAPEAERLLAEVRSIQARVRAGDTEGAVHVLVDSFSGHESAWERLSPKTRAIFQSLAGRWSEELDDPEAIRPDLEALRELFLPTLLTSGELSPPPVRRINAMLAGALRQVVVRDLADAGHVPQITDPPQYAGVVLGFLLERDIPVN